MNNDVLITVSEARKILGKEYSMHSDEYVQGIINNLDSLINSYFKMIP